MRSASAGSRYGRIRAVLCATCPIRRSCPQFPEQMDVCVDALYIQAEEQAELPRTLGEFLAEYQPQGEG